MSAFRITGDLTDLPKHGFGSRTLLWWGVLGFILIEGAAFLLACAGYVFLVGHTEPWPPNHPPPALLYGLLFTLLLLATEVPNFWLDGKAHHMDARAVRIGLVVMSLAGFLLLAVRAFEFTALNVRWEDDAYGSIVWALMVLHTAHLATDVADTVLLAVFSFTHEVDEGRFSDVADNCLYWHFVALTWFPIYALVYWAPRVL